MSDICFAESPMVGENGPILTESVNNDDAILINIPEQNNDDQSDISQSDILTQAINQTIPECTTNEYEE